LIKNHQPRGVGIQHLIRADIIKGILPLGARLQIDDLAARYDVSHMPVREALRELRGEGLVVMEPNRGARVRDLTPAFVENVFDVRSALETMMAMRAAERRPPGTGRILMALQIEFENAVASDDGKDVLDANRAFHDAVYRAADNPEAFDFFKRHWMLVAMLFDRFGYDAARMVQEVPEHRSIIHAIEHGDGLTAAALIASQIRNAKRDILSRMPKA
jgi:DNA-binding GntR family transcriptional regulator